MNDKQRQVRTKQELIVEVWEELDCDSVGAVELNRIQEEIDKRFGVLESPAAIARVLAEEGALLRHPEVLACDTQWREKEIAKAWPLDLLQFSTLTEATESLTKLAAWRREVVAEQPDSRLPLEVGLGLKQRLQLTAQSRIVGNEEIEVAKEVVQWLTVWLQDPEIFEDWLSLRQRSSEFVKRFQNSKR